MVTSREVGNGRAVYVGTYLTDSLVECLVDQLFASAGAEPLVADLPPGVEVIIREGSGRELLFWINVGGETVEVPSIRSGMNLLTGVDCELGLKLEAFGCAVVRHVLSS